MNSFSLAHFQLLKSMVLQKAGITNITPSDCKVISLLISQHTKQVISETTLKRIYGFALSKFNPSQYTIELMAKYCGYNGWKDFCEKQDISNSNKEIVPADIDWHNLKNEATKITEFTLQALKHRSGIPFNQTIQRSFVDSHMDHFMASENMATVFAAPAGYGKSLAICHWVEQQLQLNYTQSNDNIILFFSSHALMSLLHSGKGLMDWMLAILGYGADKGGRTLKELVEKNQHKFHLVIDGFDPLFFKKDEFNSLASQLEDIFSLCRGHDFFKLILTMRSATWVNHRHEWEDEKYSWFNTLSAGNEYINVPKFTLNEVNELSRKISLTDTSIAAVKTAQALSHPLYFQYYYKLHKADFSLKYLNCVTVYDILCSFIANKIYTCPQSTEKMAFITEFVDLIDFKKCDYQVDKLKINNLVKQNAATYHDLLSLGILREVNTSNDCGYENHVRFVDDNVLDHFIAKKLMQQSGGEFNSELIHQINTQLKDSTHRFPVLKWSVVDAVKNGQLQQLGYLNNTDITPVQKSMLISFISDMLNRELAGTEKHAAPLTLFKGEIGEQLFDYFFGLELVATGYKNTLLTLLKFQLTIKQRIAVYAALGAVAIFQLNINELENAIKQITTLADDRYYGFPIDPVMSLDAIFHYLKYGFVKRDALAELTKLSFALTGNNAPQFKKCAVNDMYFLLGAHTLMLAGNPKKSLRFIKIVENAYPEENPKSNYSFFIYNLKIDAQFKLGHTNNLTDLYDWVNSIYGRADGMLTTFTKAMFSCLKIKAMLRDNRDEDILDELKCMNTITDDSGNKLSKIYVLTVLLKSNEFIADNPEFKKQAGYDHNMILTKSGIDSGRFLN